MATDDERREVARRLRELPGDSTYPDLIGVIAGHDGWYPAADAADRLADLIEPSCDLEALLALADGMLDAFRVGARSGEGIDAKWCRELHDDYARRIREACNVVDVG